MHDLFDFYNYTPKTLSISNDTFHFMIYIDLNELVKKNTNMQEIINDLSQLFSKLKSDYVYIAYTPERTLNFDTISFTKYITATFENKKIIFNTFESQNENIIKIVYYIKNNFTHNVNYCIYPYSSKTLLYTLLFYQIKNITLISIDNKVIHINSLVNKILLYSNLTFDFLYFRNNKNFILDLIYLMILFENENFCILPKYYQLLHDNPYHICIISNREKVNINYTQISKLYHSKLIDISNNNITRANSFIFKIYKIFYCK